jgi:hypothetical protein
MRKRQTKEKKVAEKMVELVNDYTLDLETVGKYVATEATVVLCNRLTTVMESANYTKEEQLERYNSISY